LLTLAAGLCTALIVLLAFGYRERARDAALTAKALEDVSRSLDRVAGTQAALEVRVAGVAAAVAAAGQANARPAVTDPRRPGAPASAAAPADRPEPPRTAEAATADAATLSVVSAALQAGQWTDSDRDRMRELMATADLEARTEAIRQLSAAVNSGKVQVRTRGLPF
jgi:predicted ATP-dependent protease